jgi:hypothetical protein
MQLGSIQFIHINAQALLKVEIIKCKPIEVMQSVLACSREGELVLGKLCVSCPPNAPGSSPVLEPIQYVMHEY